jgi:hypothetical protein
MIMPLPTATVIRNDDWPELDLPSTALADGLLVWSLTGEDKNVYLAWMALDISNIPDGAGATMPLMYYSSVSTPPWSSDVTNATPLRNFTTEQDTFTHVSPVWIKEINRWIVLYSDASVSKTGGPIRCRCSPTPTGEWSDPPITLFDPSLDNGFGIGGFMYPGGYAYTPIVIADYTTWDPETQMLTIYYTMSPFNPYGVMLMRSTLSCG